MRRPVKNRNRVEPDYKYKSEVVEKFVNYVMDRGKKSIARAIVYDAFDKIKTSEKKEPMEIFETALRNASPVMEVRSRRIGGANYQVPREVRTARAIFLSMNWIINAAKARQGKPMADFLAEELILASKGEGEALKKRETMHKMAEANKAFAHFSW